MPPGDLAVHLAPGAIAAVLVGDPAWQPSARFAQNPTGRLLDGSTGQLTYPGNPWAVLETQQVRALPPLWGTFPPWSWDPGTQRFIAT